MLDLNSATARLNREIRDVENAIADALTATASLLHSATAAQQAVTSAPFSKSHATLLRISKMTAALIEVQGDVRRTHDGLLAIGVEMGAMEEPTCPDAGFTSASDDNRVSA